MPRSAVKPEELLMRLEWTVIRRLDGLLQGDYRTLFRGSGLDLADLREYQFHDDVRHIDWNVTARLGTPYVRQYNEERDLTAWFLLDLTPSLDFGAYETKKRTTLTEFVAVLGTILTRGGNRVGAICDTGESETIIAAASGRMQLHYLLNTVMEQPHLKKSPPTDLAALLTLGRKLARNRSLVFVVSDFISTPGWERQLGRLATRHEVIAVRLFDPLERELPDLGLVLMQDSETGEQLLVETGNPGFRKRFAAAVERREQELQASFSKTGVDVLELSTGEDLVSAIVRFAEARKLRRLAGAGRWTARTFTGRTV